MGLDMYLEKEKSYYSERPSVEGFEGCESLTVYGTILYWRKANQIHNWFVSNIQENKDNCERYYVSHDNIKKLRDIINTVLENNEEAATYLPTQKGFFFGGTDYNEYYFAELKRTKESLDEIIKDKNFKQYHYYYRSSW